MPLICYQPKRFDPATLDTIGKANEILDDYAAQGYDLTLRQLYYQFVARGIIANKDTEYKRLGSIINDARLAGLVDWDRITDRTRNLRVLPHWDSPTSILSACAEQYRNSRWDGQPNYVEVWVEKDALVGVLQVACEPLDVPYFSCRGYTSQSEVWGASQRLLAKVREGKRVHIIHLGDHDPSGIDMTRDIMDRLTNFLQHHIMQDFYESRPKVPKSKRTDEWARAEVTILSEETTYDSPVTVNRIALNMSQVEQYNPPPNPAKLSDSRARGYVDNYGDESWELDALEPRVITDLIQDAVFGLRDVDLWDEAAKKEEREKSEIKAVADNWQAAVDAVNPDGPGPMEED